MNIFLFNKSLRCIDNTTLINQLINEKNVIPIFIFTEQVNIDKNKYFSNNSVQFMIESLHELYEDINKKYNGKLFFFNNNNFIKILQEINKTIKINSIGTNFDYSPYAKNRQGILDDFCKKNNIKLYLDEDHLLYNILDGKVLKKDKTPYTVFTPYKNFCLKNLQVDKPNNFKKFNFIKNTELEKNKYYIKKDEIDNFYEINKFANVKGGRSYSLNILKNINKFKDYDKERNNLVYKTTFLAAYNHFGTVSIREVYYAIKKYNLHGLINELIWRDFYYGLHYYFPLMLDGQVNTNMNNQKGSNNKAYKSKFDHIKWNYDKNLFKKWCNGILGIPVCDCGMRQLNLTGFMHNRLRMVCANILTKLLLIPWTWGEKYFATKLIDYDCIQNSGGWQWTACGVDPQQVFRIFSPKLQSQKFDPDCIFIKEYIPELKDIDNNDIHNWETNYIKYKNIDYPEPQIDYVNARKISINELKRVNRE
jgi:deoxyribodipyrimidine photo-lyase